MNNIDNIELEKIKKALQEFGLSEKDSLVYLNLLSFGETGISALEREMGVHRQIIYNSLYALELLGLVKHVIVKGRRKFSAQSPRRLQILVDRKQQAALELIQKISDFATPTKEQEFEVFQGESSFIEYQMESLLDAKEGETLSILGSQWNSFYSIMGTRIENYEKLRISKGIKLRFIGSEIQKAVMEEATHKRPLFEYRIIKGLRNGFVDINIWKSAISYNIFGNPVIIFHLKNQDIAKGQQEFFDSLWALGE
jgi:sugar-specific transcriptional regulator TrmB